MLTRGRLIVIEGPDALGKSTQAMMLTNALAKKGLRVVRYNVPVKNTVTHWLHRFFLKYDFAIWFPRTFQLLSFINKMIFQMTTLKKILMSDTTVILDRWDLSALIYGQASGLSFKFLAKTYLPLQRPDLTILLDGDNMRSESNDAYERDKRLQSRVKIGYRNWFLQVHHDNAVMINANDNIEKVHSEILKAVGAKFPELNMRLSILVK